jgi:hypothetical protein
MQPGKADLGTWARGDTIRAKRHRMTQTVAETTTPIDLSGVSITMTFMLKKETVVKSIGNGITMIDAEDGVYQIDKFSLELWGVWNYDLQFVFPNGDVRTLIVGSITIIKDITKWVQ